MNTLAGIFMIRQEKNMKRLTGVKTNMRNMYSDVLCDACGIQEESQKHVIQECIKLNENQGSMFIYEKIYNGLVSEKVEIAKKFEKKLPKITGA